jgi:superfamily I DNA/RNA helicase
MLLLNENDVPQGKWGSENEVLHMISLEQMIIDLEDERRLMYVAMTRAMERLIITNRKQQVG